MTAAVVDASMAGVARAALPERMRAWVLGGPGELELIEKPVPRPAAAEVLVRIHATAVCGTDIEVLRHGAPALVQGGAPFNRNFTPGHEYMGTIAAVGAGVDEFAVGERVGALGADETIDVDRANAVDRVLRSTRGIGASYVMECSGAPGALNNAAQMTSRGGRICLAAFSHEPVMVDLARLVANNIYVFGIRGEGKSATRRAAALMAQRRIDVKRLHTHTFSMAEVPTALRYAGERIDDAIKVVVKIANPAP